MTPASVSKQSGGVDQYRCPRSGTSLVRAVNMLKSAETEAKYPVVGDVPMFLRFVPIDNHAELKLATLNAEAAKAGWRRAIERVYGEWSYVTDPSRQNVLNIVPITPTDRILEIGPGLGQMTVELARRAHSVDALEVVAGQAEFVLRRCREEGQRNVSVACGGDDCVLPYRSGHFDVAVANLVLEWCGMRNVGADPLRAQMVLIRELGRVLRPGGTLFISTKNRFALCRVLGKPDEHVGGMRFGSVLPRWVIRGIAAIGGQGEAKALLHSLWGLKRLLSVGGFVEAREYWLVPEMRWPETIVELTRPEIRRFRRRWSGRQGEYRSTDAVMRVVPSWLVKYVTPGLTLLAKRRWRQG